MSTSIEREGEVVAKMRLWHPRQVLLTKSARAHAHGRAIAERATALGAEVIAMPSDRLILRGQLRAVWERIPGRRAETLDALVYVFAARALIGNINFDNRIALLRQSGSGGPAPPSPVQQPRRRTIQSSYMQN